MEETTTLPQLTLEEQRVLGALIEKSKTTPDYYPLTLNGLVTACNQKSSRNPVVNFDDETVIIALDSLKKKHLSANVIGDGRALKYRHAIGVKYSIDPAESAVLCLLLLRGPLTPGEIKANSGRLHDFDELAEVQSTIENLIAAEPPFLAVLPRKTGQKEVRYCHLFGEIPVLDENDTSASEPARKHVSEMEERLTKVETELAELKAAFDELMRQLT